MAKTSRRQFIRLGLVTGAAIATTHCSRADAPLGTPNNPARGPEVNRNAIREVTLRSIGTGLSQIHEIRQKAESDLGFTIDMRTLPAAEVTRLAMTQPAAYDLLTSDFASLPLIIPTGNLRPIYRPRIDAFDQVVPFFTEGKFHGMAVERSCGTTPFRVMYLPNFEATEFATTPTDYVTLIPFQANAETLGYRPDATERAINSWGELFNAELRGTVALVNDPQVGILEAALAAEALDLLEFEDKGNLTRADIDALIALLMEQKQLGQFWDFWTTLDEAVDFMVDGDVVLQSMRSPAVATVKARGVDCVYAPLREGYRGWCNGIGLSKHLSGMALEAAYDYLNWLLEGWAGAFLMRQGYDIAVPAQAEKYLSQSEWDFWYEGKPASGRIIDSLGRRIERRGQRRDGGAFQARFGNIVCWNARMDENRYLVRRWNELIDLEPPPTPEPEAG